MRPNASIALVCLLSLTAGSRAAGDYYGRSLATEDAEEHLRALGPRALLRSHGSARTQRQVNATAASGTCGRDIGVVLQAIERREMWALKMLDASSKIPSGILDGNIIDLGMYDECMASRGKSLGVEIRGRHCMYSIVPSNDNGSLPLYPTLSICLPASCNATDLSSLFNITISTIDRFKDVGLLVGSVTCSPVDPVVWDTEFIVCFTILMIYIGFLVTCTAFDFLVQSCGIRHSVFRVLGRFSLQRSTSSILSTDAKEGNLPAIHGIRFFSIAWVVLGHQYFLGAFAANVNTVHIFEWIQSWRSLIIFTAPFAVDTFFTLSGFLMAYLFLKEILKRRKFNVPMYYVHRFVRLTPPVIAIVVFSIVFVPKLGSGARWESTTGIFAGGCREKWWPHLLYVQNFVDQDNLCLGHLWYLAVDMQLFWISPVILYPLYARPKIGLGILLALLLASMAIPASIIGVNRYPMESFVHSPNITVSMEIFHDIYEMPYNRAGPWLIGILLGYELNNNKRTLSKTSVIVGWLVAIGSFAFCTLGTRSFMEPTYTYNATWETFFSTVSRPIWAVGICWIIYASIYECAGPVSKILNCKYFQPLSRLSYTIYIVHIVYQVMDTAALRTPVYFSDYNVWQAYLGKLAVTIVIAFAFSLLFESPILVLEKMVLKRKTEPHQYESQRDLGIPVDEEDPDSAK